MVYRKASNAGARGAMGGFRRDAEAIYLVGPWSSGLGGRSSVLTSAAGTHAASLSRRYGHPHAKPVDVLEALMSASPLGSVADPFAGSGSTLVAARNLGREAIGVEVAEEYAERAAQRLSQQVLA